MKLDPVEVRKYLKGVNYPASREDLVLKAEQNCVPEEPLRGIRSLPDEEYRDPDQLVCALCGE